MVFSACTIWYDIVGTRLFAAFICVPCVSFAYITQLRWGGASYMPSYWWYVHYQMVLHSWAQLVYTQKNIMRYEVLYAHRIIWPKMFHIYVHRVNITIFSVQWCFWMKPYVYLGAAVNIYIEIKCLKRNIRCTLHSIASESNVVFEYFIAWDTRESYLIFTRDLLFISNSHKHLFFKTIFCKMLLVFNLM